MGRKSKKQGICVYAELTHSAVQQKLTHIVKQLYSPNFFFKEKRNACLDPKSLQEGVTIVVKNETPRKYARLLDDVKK